jgi:hypothetical protein
MNQRLNALAVMALLLAGCESTSRVMLGPTYPAITPDQVHIYYQPPARYREVALLETQSGSFTYGEQHKMDAVLNKLRIEAAKLGANGVLFQGTETGYGGSNVGVGVGGTNYGHSSSYGGGVGFSISPTQKYAHGMAIYVTDPTPAPLPPEPQPPPPAPAH